MPAVEGHTQKGALDLAGNANQSRRKVSLGQKSVRLLKVVRKRKVKGAKEKRFRAWQTEDCLAVEVMRCRTAARTDMTIGSEQRGETASAPKATGVDKFGADRLRAMV